jgi:transposase
MRVAQDLSTGSRERYRLSASKSDIFDAFVLADTLRHEHRRWRPLSSPSALTAELQAVSRDRQRVLHAKVACESRLRAVLETYYPTPLHLFSALDRDISLEFIRAYPTPDQARRIKTGRMAAFCDRQHYSGRTNPQVLVDRLIPHLLSATDGTTAATVDVLLAETGLAPVTKASGRTRQVRFRYAANRRMRHVIDWWVFVAAREDAWSKTVYETSRARGQGKYRALRGLGARWTRILWRCWTDHTCYDPARRPRPELTAA